MHQLSIPFSFSITDIYSSHTSSSFSPSPSTEGAETPNSLIHDAENNRLTANIEENGNERAMKKSKLNENCLKSDKSSVDGVQHNGEGTYHCQFCEKSFPRLGYLKKHEQVNDFRPYI